MAKQVLGRGLDALLKQSQSVLGTTETTKAGSSVQKIAVENIVPNRFQPRRTFNEDSLAELAQSIKQHGLTQPVVVVYDAGLAKYELVVGERRFRASQIAGLREVDAIVHSSMSDKEMATLALIENIQREDLNPIETALGYKILIQKFQISQTELADFCGKSKAAVSNSLRLLELEKDIQAAIEKGDITEGHGRALLMLPDGKKRQGLFNKIKAGKLSVRQAEEGARTLLAPAKAEPKKARPAEELTFEEALQQALGTKVELKNTPKNKGTLVIHYNSLEQLENIADRLKSKML